MTPAFTLSMSAVVIGVVAVLSVQFVIRRLAQMAERVRLAYEETRPEERIGIGLWLFWALAFAWWWSLVLAEVAR